MPVHSKPPRSDQPALPKKIESTGDLLIWVNSLKDCSVEQRIRFMMALMPYTTEYERRGIELLKAAHHFYTEESSEVSELQARVRVLEENLEEAHRAWFDAGCRLEESDRFIKNVVDYSMSLLKDRNFKRDKKLLDKLITDHIKLLRDEKEAERKRAEEEKKRADRLSMDRLTNLYRQGVVEELLIEFLLKEPPRTVLSLVFLDIDNLKIVNDTMGHPMGHRVIQRAGKVIRQEMRSSLGRFRAADIAGRHAGDEFIICLFDGEHGIDLAERICAGYNNTNWWRAAYKNWDEGVPYPSLSAGVVFMDIGEPPRFKAKNGLSPKMAKKRIKEKVTNIVSQAVELVDATEYESKRHWKESGQHLIYHERTELKDQSLVVLPKSSTTL